jgi:hypothetical protein
VEPVVPEPSKRLLEASLVASLAAWSLDKRPTLSALGLIIAAEALLLVLGNGITTPFPARTCGGPLGSRARRDAIQGPCGCGIGPRKIAAGAKAYERGY